MGTTDGGKTPGKQPSQQSPKGLIYYFLTIFLVTMLLNALVFPNVMEEKVMEVNYNEFLAMVDAGKVVQVEKDTDQIMFLATDAQGKEQIYKTGLWEDEALTNRLYKAGVTFGKVIPHKESALMNFLTTWILPFGLMFLMGHFLSRMMAKRMGGNAMTFGKSNAKIYAENETGKTFADVAGEEEAKEALKEIVDFLHDPKKYAVFLWRRDAGGGGGPLRQEPGRKAAGSGPDVRHHLPEDRQYDLHCAGGPLHHPGHLVFSSVFR